MATHLLWTTPLRLRRPSFRYRHRKPNGGSGTQRREPLLPYGRAFTLTEVLVAVLIVGVLIAVVSPSLRGGRRAATEAEMLARGGQHAAVFFVYALDYRDCHPFLTDPWSGDITVFTAKDGGRYNARFCDTIFAWNIALADGYYNSDTRSKAFAPRGESRGYWANFYYGLAFTTRPEFWNPRTRESVPNQFGATTVAEVSWPSKKALLVEANWERAEWTANERPVAAFCDGHSIAVRGDTAEEQAFAPPQELRPRWTVVATPWFGLFNAPLDGVRGRDVK